MRNVQAAELPPWEPYRPTDPQVLTLKPGQRKVQLDFDAQHRCSFWNGLEGQG